LVGVPYLGALAKNNGSLNKTDKKAQLSLTNPRDAKACQKLLQFDVLTTLPLTVGQVRIGDTFVCPVTAVRDLGVHLDADVSMTAHVRATVRSCFAALRQIRSVHRSLSRDALVALIRALVVTY